MKNIPGFDGYAATEDGQIYSYKSNKYLFQRTTDKGYKQVGLYYDGKQKFHYVHRLVALAYIPNPDELPLINHKDQNPSNNHVSNLEWCTPEYNSNYGTRAERASEAISKPVYCIELDKVFKSGLEAAKELKISSGNISACCTGRRETAHGYHFTFVEEEDIKKAKKVHYSRQRKAVYCEETGKVYNSQTEVANELGVSRSMVSAVCRGEYPTCRGHHIRFATDEEVLKYKLKKSFDELTAAVEMDLEAEKADLEYKRIARQLKAVVS